MKLLVVVLVFLSVGFACKRSVPDGTEQLDGNMETGNDADNQVKTPPPVGEMKDGQRQGQWVFTHANGKKSAEGEYKAGKKDGSWVFYYENGNKAAEGDYKAGLKHGKWVDYKEDGSVDFTKSYQNGEEVF